MLAVLISGTQTRTNQSLNSETPTEKNEHGKTTNMHFTVILGLTLHNKAIEKDDRYFGRMRWI